MREAAEDGVGRVEAELKMAAVEMAAVEAAEDGDGCESVEVYICRSGLGLNWK